MHFLFSAIAFTLILVPARADSPGAAPASSVVEHHNVEYRKPAEGEASTNHNRLDMYLPADVKDFPVVLIVHGGAWMMGDKNWDQVPAIGRASPSRASAPSASITACRRLSSTPSISATWPRRSPGSIGTSANTAAAGQAHRHGPLGRRTSRRTLGHRRQYLKAHGLSRDNVQGVIGVSGVYQISEIALNALGQRRRPAAPNGTPPPPLFEQIFGKEPNTARRASPLSYICKGLPPFLLIYAEKDLPTLGLQAMALEAAMKAQKNECTLMKVDGAHTAP